MVAAEPAVVVPLGDAALHRDYLRIVWRGTSRSLSPVTVHRARLITRDKPTGGGPSVEGSAPPLTDAHTIEFGIPFAAAISAIRSFPPAATSSCPFVSSTATIASSRGLP